MGSPYEAPAYGSNADTLLGWFLEARQEGEAWLAAQPTSRGWTEAMQLMDEPTSGGRVDQSNVAYPKVKRISRELVASLSNFRHEGEFKVLWDNTLYDTAHLLTELDRNWYRTTFANREHRRGLQYAVNLGTAYWEQTWDPTFWGPNRGEVRLNALSPADVTFVQLPKDNDIQGAYVVIIRREVPINLARRQWMTKNPAFAMGLVPDRETATNSWVTKGLQKVQQFLSPALRVAGRTGSQSKEGAYPTVDIYTAYTMDTSINEGITPVTMGAYGTNWQYTVPCIGDPIDQDIINPATGQPFTLPAKASDCLMFPLRRMTIFSNTGVAYDGSSPWWHGEVPIARVWFNDSPWNALGGSLTADITSMETGIVELMRGIEDSAAARLDPPALVDDRMSDSWGQAINPRKAGVRAKAPLDEIEVPISFPFPVENYNVPNWIMQWIEAQEGRMDYVSGVRDLVAMAKAKQVPGADTLEKLMEMAGPLVQDMVRALEEPLTKLGDWRKSYYMQFYTEGRIITTAGPDDGADQWSTTEFISPKLREQLKQKSLQVTPQMLIPGLAGMTAKQANEKTKRLIDEFFYEVTESGLNEIHRMSTKLLYFQLLKLDFPLSPWTLARIMRIPNFGPPPEGTNTEMERWVAWKRMRLELDVELAAEAQGMGEASTPQAMAGAAPEGGGSSPKGGRPNSFQKAPHLEQKDGGMRSTVSTS